MVARDRTRLIDRLTRRAMEPVGATLAVARSGRNGPLAAGRDKPVPYAWAIAPRSCAKSLKLRPLTGQIARETPSSWTLSNEHTAKDKELCPVSRTSLSCDFPMNSATG